MLLVSIYYHMHNCNLNMKLGVIVVFGLSLTGDICHHWPPQIPADSFCTVQTNL